MLSTDYPEHIIYNKESSVRYRDLKIIKRLTTRGSTEIPCPDSPSEIDITSKILAYLVSNGLNAKSEVLSLDGTCRFDIVIFKNKRPVKIIEVKTDSGVFTHAQKCKYKRFHIPFQLIKGMREARRYMKIGWDVKNIPKIKTNSVYIPPKITEEGQLCDICNSPVYKIFLPKFKNASFQFLWLLKCKGCNKIHFSKSANEV